MLAHFTTGLLCFAAIGCALMAGVYFSFSAFIMTAFARIAPPSGIAAMNAINEVILKSLFMPLFVATTLAAAILIGVGLLRWNDPSSEAMIFGGTIYVIGMFLVTMVFNMPLNNALAAVEKASLEAEQVWSRHLIVWTRWNHVRTIASTAAAAAFIIALGSLRG